MTMSIKKLSFENQLNTTKVKGFIALLFFTLHFSSCKRQGPNVDLISLQICGVQNTSVCIVGYGNGANQLDSVGFRIYNDAFDRTVFQESTSDTFRLNIYALSRNSTYYYTSVGKQSGEFISGSTLYFKTTNEPLKTPNVVIDSIVSGVNQAIMFYSITDDGGGLISELSHCVLKGIDTVESGVQVNPNYSDFIVFNNLSDSTEYTSYITVKNDSIESSTAISTFFTEVDTNKLKKPSVHIDSIVSGVNQALIFYNVTDDGGGNIISLDYTLRDIYGALVTSNSFNSPASQGSFPLTSLDDSTMYEVIIEICNDSICSNQMSSFFTTLMDSTKYITNCQVIGINHINSSTGNAAITLSNVYSPTIVEIDIIGNNGFLWDTTFTASQPLSDSIMIEGWTALETLDFTSVTTSIYGSGSSLFTTQALNYQSQVIQYFSFDTTLVPNSSYIGYNGATGTWGIKSSGVSGNCFGAPNGSGSLGSAVNGGKVWFQSPSNQTLGYLDFYSYTYYAGSASVSPSVKVGQNTINISSTGTQGSFTHFVSDTVTISGQVIEISFNTNYHDLYIDDISISKLY